MSLFQHRREGILTLNAACYPQTPSMEEREAKELKLVNEQLMVRLERVNGALLVASKDGVQ